MWQRFTERARRVMFFAQEEAGRLGSNDVGADHLVLGLVRESDTAAAHILDRLGVSRGRLRSAIETQIVHGKGVTHQDMQLTPRAKQVIDLAYAEARELNTNYIGTEHLLLGVIREGESLGAVALQKLKVDLEKVRAEVKRIQDADPRGRPADWEEIRKEVAGELLQLPREQQEALTNGGLDINELPVTLRNALRSLAQPHAPASKAGQFDVTRVEVFETPAATGDKPNFTITLHAEIRVMFTPE